MINKVRDKQIYNILGSPISDVIQQIVLSKTANFLNKVLLIVEEKYHPKEVVKDTKGQNSYYYYLSSLEIWGKKTNEAL